MCVFDEEGLDVVLVLVWVVGVDLLVVDVGVFMFVVEVINYVVVFEVVVICI